MTGIGWEADGRTGASELCTCAHGAHSAFHRASYVASHNTSLIGMLDGLWDRSDRYRRLGLMPPSGAEDRERDFVEHRKMMEMIIDREAPGIAELLRQPIRPSLTVAAIDALDDQLGNAASPKRPDARVR